MEKNQQEPKKNDELEAEINEVEEEYSCYEGKLFIIPQKKKWIVTLCLIQIPTILHEIFHLEWFSHLHHFGALYVLFISQFLNLWTLMNLCLEDPGFMQRIKYGYEIDEEFTKVPKNENINNHFQTSFVLVRGQQTQRMKLCSTCNIYRPLRTSHCGECGVCVQRMDHHCPWVGTCIGKKNYLYFYLFLLSLLVLIVTIIVMCIMIMVGSDEDPSEFGERLKMYPLSIVLVLFPCVEGLFFVLIMFAFHTYLLFIDQTTKQFFDEKWIPEIGNPDKKRNCLKNFVKIMFRVQRRHQEYKHKAFPYYNAEPQSSSNTNHRNSKGSSDPEKRQKHSEMSEENIQNAYKDQQEVQPKNENKINVSAPESQNRLKQRQKN